MYSYFKKIKNANWKLWQLIYIFVAIAIVLTTNLILIIFDSTNYLWISILSIFAVLTGIISTIIATKGLSHNYVFGLIHVLLYGIVSFAIGVYGDFMLNIFIYLPMNFWGMYIWFKKEKEVEDGEKPTPRKIKHFHWTWIILLIVILILIYGYLLTLLGEPWQVSLFDASSTITSIFGMTLMSLYFREQWIIWFLVNVFSILIYVSLLLTTGNLISIIYILMWSIYLINSIIGSYEWFIKNNH